VMGSDQAANVLGQVKIEQAKTEGVDVAKKVAEIKQSISESYEREGSAYYSTSRLWDDGIINPLDTRQILGRCLESVQFGDWSHTHGFGLFRM
jgi:3-methylcrotonyl-CoA carboxylase beta subunit